VEEVRRAGAIALGRLGDRKAIGFLERAAAGDESNSVRILAALAIGAIG
jgi:HEAT repeat protein